MTPPPPGEAAPDAEETGEVNAKLPGGIGFGDIDVGAPPPGRPVLLATSSEEMRLAQPAICRLPCTGPKSDAERGLFGVDGAPVMMLVERDFGVDGTTPPKGPPRRLFGAPAPTTVPPADVTPPLDVVEDNGWCTTTVVVPSAPPPAALRPGVFGLAKRIAAAARFS